MNISSESCDDVFIDFFHRYCRYIRCCLINLQLITYGRYTDGIQASGLSNPNYDFVYQEGTLIVNSNALVPALVTFKVNDPIPVTLTEPLFNTAPVPLSLSIAQDLSRGNINRKQ